MIEKKRWKKINSTNIYSSEYISLYKDTIELPNSSRIVYEWFNSPSFCVMIPILKDKFIMIENYRYPADAWSLEFPAGHLKEGEEPEIAAKRELLEETGYEAGTMEYLGWSYVSSRTLQKGYVFLCKDLKKLKPKREPYEIQMIKIVTQKYIENAIKNNIITDAATLVAYSFYIANIK
jgi:ADP-ribose pyrophosphatase